MEDGGASGVTTELNDFLCAAALEDLQNAQLALERDPYNEEYKKAESNAMEVFRSLNSLWLAQLKQHAKIAWIKERDRNSRYFHAMVRKRRQANQIHLLMNEYGGLVTNPEQIKELILRFYG